MTNQLCCENCFSDKYLKDFLWLKGKPGECSFCSIQNSYCLNPADLREVFLPLVELYSPIIDFMPMEELKETEGKNIAEILAETWEIFENQNNAEAITKLILGPSYDCETWMENEEEYAGEYLESSSESEKLWNEFRDNLRHKNRFFNPELKNVTSVLPLIITNFVPGFNFYRARKSEKLLPSAEMGLPPKEKASAGRGNPEGISYLYLASDDLTAISEIKPYIQQYVTVGVFKVKNNLSLVDLRKDNLDSPFRYGKNLKFALYARSLLFILGNELSKPIEPQTKHVNMEYLPTQYLCELIKTNGHDGVLYKSSLGSGFNILLFFEEKVLCEETVLCQINDVTYSVIKK